MIMKNKLYHQGIAGMLFLFLTVLTCVAKESFPPLDTLLKEIEQRVANTRTVQARFRQERHLSLFNQPIVFEGMLALSRPHQLRWELTSPIPSVLIFSGNQGMRCSEDMQPRHFDLQTDPVMRMVAQQLWTWADGAYGRLQNEYDITLINSHAIELKPTKQAMRKVVEAVRVVFDQESLQPSRVTVVEADGDTLIITFREYRLNKPIPETLFTKCARQPIPQGP